MPELNLLPLWSNDRECDDHSSILRIINFPYALGRGTNCDHRIDDPIVSRHHFFYGRRSDLDRRPRLEERHSGINGQLLVEPCTLADGDTLAIGYYTYLICLGEMPIEAPMDQWAVLPEC